MGKATVPVPGMVEIVDGEKKGTILKASKILICTGAKPKRIPGLEVDGKRVMTSREALARTDRPASVVVVGAGAIGVEFSYFYNAFGTKVTLVEMLPTSTPTKASILALS